MSTHNTPEAPTVRSITSHRNDSNDYHDSTEIHSDDKRNHYSAVVAEPGQPSRAVATLNFQRGCVNAPADINGWSNEMLLAVVEDRLKGFQGGKFGCEENARAITAIREALNHLNARTARRKREGTEGTYQEKPMEKQAKARVFTEAYTLVIGEDRIDVDDLKQWGAWPRVEAAVKKVVKDGTRLTDQEMAVIRACAVTPGGKNGLKEFEQAYHQSQ